MAITRPPEPHGPSMPTGGSPVGGSWGPSSYCWSCHAGSGPHPRSSPSWQESGASGREWGVLGLACSFWGPRCLHAGLGDSGLAGSLLPALFSACRGSEATKLNLPASRSQGTRGHVALSSAPLLGACRWWSRFQAMLRNPRHTSLGPWGTSSAVCSGPRKSAVHCLQLNASLTQMGRVWPKSHPGWPNDQVGSPHPQGAVRTPEAAVRARCTGRIEHPHHGPHHKARALALRARS